MRRRAEGNRLPEKRKYRVCEAENKDTSEGKKPAGGDSLFPRRTGSVARRLFRARSGKRKSGRKREDGFRLRSDGGRAKKERKGKELADEEIYEENELFKRKKKRRLA